MKTEEFTIYDWYGTYEKLKCLGYRPIDDKHLEFHPKGKSLFETAEDIFEQGINVMIRRFSNENVVLHTSISKFGQR